MAKPGNKNNKERCQKYKTQGRREKNKRLKQERNEKRIARFAKRKAEGKGFWGKDRTRTEDPSGSNVTEKELFRDYANDHRLPYARETSVFRKLANKINGEALELKHRMEKIGEKNGKKKTKEE